MLADHAPPLKFVMQIDSQLAIHNIKSDRSSGAQKAVHTRYHALEDAWRQGTMALE